MSDRWTRVSDALDAVSRRTGHAIAWLTLALGLAGTAVVVLRYAFDSGWIWMQESLTWMHALTFMLGAAYTLEADEHVRVDIFYRGWSPRAKAVVDLLGTLLFLLPLCAFLLWASFPYVEGAWRIGERSREAGGLPALYLLKTAIPALAVLLALQGVSGALRCVVTLARRPGT